MRDAGDEVGWVEEFRGGNSVFAPHDGVDLFGRLLAGDLNICIDGWKERQAPNWRQLHFDGETLCLRRSELVPAMPEHAGLLRSVTKFYELLRSALTVMKKSPAEYRGVG